jgi:GNAT superfamily N-acetyltransferase
MTITAPALITVTIDNVGADTAERLAVFTRRAYAGSDPLPGLPVPDGAVEGADHVIRFLEGGGTIRVAQMNGTVVGVLRTTVLPDGAWWVARVAIAPSLRGRGFGARLMAEVEAVARAQGARAVRLDAVIERCLVPYYARIGYRISAYHVPDDGKVLTEAAMERDLTRPPEPMPHLGTPPGSGGGLSWFTTPTGMVAAIHPHRGIKARLAGMDAWQGDLAHLAELVRQVPGARPTSDPSVVEFLGGRADVPLHLTPRAVHGDLWALARYRPGHETHQDFSDHGSQE